MHPTPCDERNLLRQKVYEILEKSNPRNGSHQTSLLQLARSEEWKCFIKLLYTHIRTCPICRSKPPIYHSTNPGQHPSS